MIFFTKKNEKGTIIATNLNNESPLVNYKTKYFPTDSGILTLISNEEALINSSKTFRRVGEFCAASFELIHKNFIDQIIAHSHTLKKIQGQLTQRMDGVVGSSVYNHAQNYEEQRKTVLKRVKEKPDEITDSLIYLHKRIFELGAHMASFEILHMGENLALDNKNHNIRRLLINILHGFEDKFNELSIKPHFMFEDEIAEANKIEVDYKTLNAAFYNFFDNVTKYVKPHSEVRFYLVFDGEGQFTLSITMKSLRIDQDELKKVFELGYRGRNCLHGDGSGIGMYVISKAFNLNSLTLEISPDYSNMERIEGQQYILNKFIIKKV